MPNALETGAAKCALCAEFNLSGVFPLDGGLELDGLEPRRQGRAIYQSNIDLIASCDLLIANLTPFRGPSADAGTAFELGYMAALGKPVLAYSKSAQSFRIRTEAHYGGIVHRRDDGQLAGPDDLAIEEFDMADNLMLHGALPEGGLFLHRAAPSELYSDLTAFRQAVRMAASFSSW